ncbi:DUF177 domain-containing protein [bacterium]|nr:DUF177 domain-containing protein [bacterium]
MKLGLAQLKTGENAFLFSSQNDPWLRDLEKALAEQCVKITSGLNAQVMLTKLEPDYFLKGALQFEVKQVCGRCAESFSLPVLHGFELGLAHVQNTARGQLKDSVSDESEELDIVYFEGQEVDLSPILEEQVLLSLPYAPICRPDCKGICQSCGSDLNQGQCQCKKTNPLNAFAALAQYKC